MSKRPKTRWLYLVKWWDIEGDAGWGEGEERPVPVVEPAFIISWPKKNQNPPTLRICHSYAEDGPWGPQTIPAGCLMEAPTKICRVNMVYREDLPK